MLTKEDKQYLESSFATQDFVMDGINAVVAGMDRLHQQHNERFDKIENRLINMEADITFIKNFLLENLQKSSFFKFGKFNLG